MLKLTVEEIMRFHFISSFAYFEYDNSEIAFNLPGLPPTSLTVDLQHIYWSNETENKLYKIPKTKFLHSENVSSLYVPGLKKIQAYGRHLQPLPGNHYNHYLTYSIYWGGGYNSRKNIVSLFF